MSHSTPSLCCRQPQPRLDSPSPPPRIPLTLASSLNAAIFSTAALPEDHPHALWVPHKKPGVDGIEGIVQSPGIRGRVRMKLGLENRLRRGKGKEGFEDVQEGDARVLTSEEVLRDVEGVEEEERGLQKGGGHVRFGSVTPLEKGDHDPTTIEGPMDIVELAERVAALKPGSSDMAHDNDAPPPLPKSESAPVLPANEGVPQLELRQSRSDSGLHEASKMQASGPGLATVASKANGPAILSSQDVTRPELAVPKVHIREPTGEDLLWILPAMATQPDPPLQRSSSDHEIHLQNMGISQQLRCMSQLSDAAEDESHPATPRPWTFHHRDRSDPDRNPQNARRPRHVSSSGLDSTNVPSCWGRVRSPAPDTASSIYSRPTSAGTNAFNHRADSPGSEPAVPMVDYGALFADWPLKPSSSAEQTFEALPSAAEDSAACEQRNKPLPPTPFISREKSTVCASQQAANVADNVSVKWLSPVRKPASIRSKGSSSVHTKDSKFQEQLSPPRKLVRKRRSIWRFLRGGSHKKQVRSISNPLLSVPLANPVIGLDGHSEDPALLTVHYEMEERPAQAARSLSMNNLTADATLQLPMPGGLQRRPTLAEYEKNLSVIGDDRRRPSAVNVHRAKEVLEDDHRESLGGLRRRISRARPLKDDASPLMAQALEKHQQEKALFRSASKQRESVKSAHGAPVFKSSSPFSSFAPGPDDRSEHVDPLENRHVAGASGRSFSSTHLLPPGASFSSSAITSLPRAVSANTISSTPASSEAPFPKRRIGTSLESWSRYPSHTRAERCGAAGRADNVITRDFAVDVNHEDIHEADTSSPISPQSKQSSKSRFSRSRLPKSRSATFSSIVRYYSNIFSSSGTVGQNRRTSVTTGGRLEYPELEMLPPQLAGSPPRVYQKHPGTLAHWKDIAKKDIDMVKEFVEEEEEKMEGFVKEEEQKIGGFVRKEEDLLDGFMKKEEGKLKSYVKAEEDKFKKHHRRHRRSDERGSSPGKESPFQEISLFEVPPSRSRESSRRRSSMVGPTESIGRDEEGASEGGCHVDAGLTHDGAVEKTASAVPTTASKADLWSDMYRECLRRPTPTTSRSQDDLPASAARKRDSVSMPPPLLRPVKPRTPDQGTKKLDSGAIVRRFPSVTVVDDRKGHCRSISLISVKTSRSGIERSSTHDLIELLQAREKEERERLLRPVGSWEGVSRSAVV